MARNFGVSRAHGLGAPRWALTDSYSLSWVAGNDCSLPPGACYILVQQLFSFCDYDNKRAGLSHTCRTAGVTARGQGTVGWWAGPGRVPAQQTAGQAPEGKGFRCLARDWPWTRPAAARRAFCPERCRSGRRHGHDQTSASPCPVCPDKGGRRLSPSAKRVPAPFRDGELWTQSAVMQGKEESRRGERALGAGGDRFIKPINV